ncbi:MAG: helix-turn-helix domain-containing protein [Trebonia sp.]
MAGRGASVDDTARFLRELRQLRDGAGLGQAELAARAHFPYDFIRAAEVGPALPDLPVLSAYVRGCGGTPQEWEERWRSLTMSPSLPVSEARNAGCSDAATAGARISSVSPVGDAPDPSIIIAALNRVAEEMASPAPDAVPPSPDVQAAGDFPPAPEPFPPAPEPGGKPAGWDPIRVSTAWPALRDTPTLAGAPAGSNGSSGAAGAGMADVAAPRGEAAPGAARGPAAAGGHPSSRTRVVMIAAVLLCVLAVLLAIFA